MTSSSSPELPRCDTALSLGLGRTAPAPSRCRGATGELKQQKQAAATPCCCCVGGGLTATELQATAILRVARRAAAPEPEAAEQGVSVDGGGAAGLLSMRRSIEWFLERRREARRLSLRGVGVAAATSPSSSSSSCLTY